jgi:hypothetical protein
VREVHADPRAEAAEKQAAGPKNAPQLRQHLPEVIVIPRKVKHGTAEHNVGKSVRERHALNRPYLKVFIEKPRFQGCGKAADMFDTFAIGIQREDLAAFSQQIHQIAPVPASSVQHAHSGGDVSPKNLIEDVDVDLSKLFLKAHTQPYRF